MSTPQMKGFRFYDRYPSKWQAQKQAACLRAGGRTARVVQKGWGNYHLFVGDKKRK